MSTSSLFPHTKLDWYIGKLEKQVEERPDDPATRLDLARSVLSRGLFHGGGEHACHTALAHARKILTEDPASVDGQVVAGLALIGMERPEAAAKYLDQALRVDGEHAGLRFAFGALERARGDLGASVRQFESACRLSPEAWEAHLYLGRALGELARHRDNPRRLVERSQFHLVRALKLEPPPDLLPSLIKDMGISCIVTGRYHDAEKFFIRLREHDKFQAIARYHLGQVAYELGKYNNAIQHFRQYLRDRPSDAKVLARTAMAWFQLGEYPKAREACNQALLLDPTNPIARHALGCTLLEEGEPNEAVRVFREALKEHPDHLPTYIELVRTRRMGGDVRWLAQALQSEVGGYDRLPHGGEPDPRRGTRQRVQILLDELKAIGPSTAGVVLACIELCQDEALRFQLWEAACAMAAGAVADSTATRLRDPGKNYSARMGIAALAVADSLPDPVLTAGLAIEDADIKRAAVDRHQAANVSTHRKNLIFERNQARAHQAMLLLAIATRRSAAGRTLLESWSQNPDTDLATAAWTGLAMYGNPEATRRLKELGSDRGASGHVDRLLRHVTPAPAPARSRKGGGSEQTQCTTCGRPPGEVTHLMAGGDVVVCDRCAVRISQHRRSLSAKDDATCDLCNRSPFEVQGLYGYNGVHICSGCLQLSLGLLEREEVDRFLASW